MADDRRGDQAGARLEALKAHWYVGPGDRREALEQLVQELREGPLPGGRVDGEKEQRTAEGGPEERQTVGRDGHEM